MTLPMKRTVLVEVSSMKKMKGRSKGNTSVLFSPLLREALSSISVMDAPTVPISSVETVDF